MKYKMKSSIVSLKTLSGEEFFYTDCEMLIDFVEGGGREGIVEETKQKLQRLHCVVNAMFMVLTEDQQVRVGKKLGYEATDG